MPSPNCRYQVALTADGKVVLIRTVDRYATHALPGARDVMVLDERVAGGWQPVELEGRDEMSALFDPPRLCLDKQGKTVVVWLAEEPGKTHSTAKLWMRMRAPDGAWSAKRLVSDPESIDVGNYVVVCGDDNTGGVLWSDAREQHTGTVTHPRDRYSKLFWRPFAKDDSLGSVVRVTPQRGKYIADDVVGRVGQGELVFALWNQWEVGGPSSIYLSSLDAGQWSYPIRVSELSKEPHAFFDVAAVSSGSALVVWNTAPPKEELRLADFSDGKLSSPTTLGSATSCVRVGSGPGHVYLIHLDRYPWREPERLGRLFLRTRMQAEWSPEIEVAKQVFFDTVSLLVDQQGRAHLFWQEQQGSEAQLIHAIYP